MCYLIAKKFNSVGCIAVEAERGDALAALVSDLGIRTLEKGIQILTITDMEMYGEYKPYTVISSQEEFITQVLNM